MSGKEKAPRAGVARLALRDCISVLEKMHTDPKGAEWRIAWIAAVALLRAVGHVLDKVDAEIDPRLRRPVDAWWVELNESKPLPTIFWDFIEQERNNVLKELTFGARQNVTVQLGHIELNVRTGESRSTPGGPIIYDYGMGAGPFADRDPRDVVEEAIEWWHEQLDGIEAGAAGLRKHPLT